MDVWNLQPGTVIRIVKTFQDCYGAEFAAGRTLHFTHRNYLPYHAGHTVYFQEATMYLSDNDATCAIVQNHKDEYFVVISQPEGEEAERIAQLQAQAEAERTRGAVAAGKRQHYKTLAAGVISVAVAFGVAIPLGFWLRPHYPAISDNVFAVIVVVVLFVTAAATMMGLRRVLRIGRPRRSTTVKRGGFANNNVSVVANVSGESSGYEISLDDFRRLVTDPACQPVVQPLLREWFGCEIVGTGPKTELHSHQNDAIELRDLYQQIQSDPARQRTIYNRAMDLWR